MQLNTQDWESTIKQAYQNALNNPRKIPSNITVEAISMGFIVALKDALDNNRISHEEMQRIVAVAAIAAKIMVSN